MKSLTMVVASLSLRQPAFSIAVDVEVVVFVAGYPDQEQAEL